MTSIDLDNNDWQQIMAILANTTNAPWSVTNPLLMKIGQQLRDKPDHGPNGRFKSGNSREVPAAQAQFEVKGAD